MSQIDTLTDEQIDYARRSLESARTHIEGARESNALGMTSRTAGHILWAEKLVKNALSVFETPSVLRAVREFECEGQLSTADLHRVDL